MVFAERKTEKGFEYECWEVFGHLKLESDIQLGSGILDGVVGLILKQNLSAREVKGEVKHEKGVLKYVLEPESQWQESDSKEDESWNDTHTSTKKPEKGSTQKRLSKIPILNSLQRFAAAFREAWKNGESYQQDKGESNPSVN